jgi:hypothetical protein
MADKNFKVKTGLDLPAPLSVEQGGTGQTTVENAAAALLPVQTDKDGQVLITNGSTLQWEDLGDKYIESSEKAAVSGVATLDEESKLSYDQIPTALLAALAAL